MLQRFLGSECQERGRKIAGSACHSVFQAREQNGLRAYGSFSRLGTKSCILQMVAAVLFQKPHVTLSELGVTELCKPRARNPFGCSPTPRPQPDRAEPKPWTLNQNLQVPCATVPSLDLLEALCNARTQKVQQACHPLTCKPRTSKLPSNELCLVFSSKSMQAALRGPLMPRLLLHRPVAGVRSCAAVASRFTWSLHCSSFFWLTNYILRILQGIPEKNYNGDDR